MTALLFKRFPQTLINRVVTPDNLKVIVKRIWFLVKDTLHFYLQFVLV